MFYDSPHACFQLIQLVQTTGTSYMRTQQVDTIRLKWMKMDSILPSKWFRFVYVLLFFKKRGVASQLKHSIFLDNNPYDYHKSSKLFIPLTPYSGILH